jgi:hypothetical protein
MALGLPLGLFLHFRGDFLRFPFEPLLKPVEFSGVILV